MWQEQKYGALTVRKSSEPLDCMQAETDSIFPGRHSVVRKQEHFPGLASGLAYNKDACVDLLLFDR